MKISGWGNYPVIDANIRSADPDGDLSGIVQSSGSLIARGLGRSYGDSSLNENMISMMKCNRILSFDPHSGLVDCEAGVSLEELLAIFVPRGWFLPVTPGTKFVTVGGAIASDVHGKTHHSTGSFSEHIETMDVMISDGSVITCSHKKNSDLFKATAGGMGLTGIILRASFKLMKIETAYIKAKNLRTRNLDEAMDAFDESEKYFGTMAWIDCLTGGEGLGRSILTVGDVATVDDLPSEYKTNPLIIKEKNKMNIPVDFPNIALNSLTMRAFNLLYYYKEPKERSTITTYDQFYYPLDVMHNWNRIYGKRGFTQYQFVLPLESSKEGLKDILSRIVKSGMGSFLAVLKKFGNGNDNYLSFPMPGYTLALDFAINRYLFKFLDELDRAVIDYGGRFYLTKDVRIHPSIFKKGYEHFSEFQKVKKKYNKKNVFQSLQSRRIEL